MFGPHFFGRHHARPFERGDLKYVVLDILKDKPSHGYDIIRELEERSHGFYSPSAGSVYPTLQLLEDLGYVTAAEQDGKKIYTITGQGSAFLKERKENMEKIREHLKGMWSPENREEIAELFGEFRTIGQTLRHNISRIDHDKLIRIKETVAKARQDIEAILK